MKDLQKFRYHAVKKIKSIDHIQFDPIKTYLLVSIQNYQCTVFISMSATPAVPLQQNQVRNRLIYTFDMCIFCIPWSKHVNMLHYGPARIHRQIVSSKRQAHWIYTQWQVTRLASSSSRRPGGQEVFRKAIAEMPGSGIPSSSHRRQRPETTGLIYQIM